MEDKNVEMALLKARLREFAGIGISEDVHEYIDSEDDSGFVTCNDKGEII